MSDTEQEHIDEEQNDHENLETGDLEDDNLGNQSEDNLNGGDEEHDEAPKDDEDEEKGDEDQVQDEDHPREDEEEAEDKPDDSGLGDGEGEEDAQQDAAESIQNDSEHHSTADPDFGHEEAEEESDFASKMQSSRTQSAATHHSGSESQFQSREPSRASHPEGDDEQHQESQSPQPPSESRDFTSDEFKRETTSQPDNSIANTSPEVNPSTPPAAEQPSTSFSFFTFTQQFMPPPVLILNEPKVQSLRQQPLKAFYSPLEYRNATLEEIAASVLGARTALPSATVSAPANGASSFFGGGEGDLLLQEMKELRRKRSELMEQKRESLERARLLQQQLQQQLREQRAFNDRTSIDTGASAPVQEPRQARTAPGGKSGASPPKVLPAAPAGTQQGGAQKTLPKPRDAGMRSARGQNTSLSPPRGGGSGNRLTHAQPGAQKGASGASAPQSSRKAAAAPLKPVRGGPAPAPARAHQASGTGAQAKKAAAPQQKKTTGNAIGGIAAPGRAGSAGTARGRNVSAKPRR